MIVNDSIQYKAVYQTGGINLYPNNLDPEVSSFTSLVDFDWGGLPYNKAFSFPDGLTSGNHLFETPEYSTWHTFSIYVKMDDGSEPVTASDGGTPDFQVSINGSSNYGDVLKTYIGDNIWRIIVTKNTGFNGQSGIRRTFGQVSGKGFKVIGAQFNPGQTPDEPTPTFGTPVTEKKVKPFTVINGNTLYGKKRILYDTGAIFAKAQDKNFEVPEVREKLLINEFIRQETRVGNWDRQDLYMHFAYNTPELTQFARINWRNPFGKGTVYNLCTHSDNFADSGWFIATGTITPNTTETTAPDGSNTAVKFDGYGNAQKTGIIATATTLTYSIYIKRGTVNDDRPIRLRDDTTANIVANANINLATGNFAVLTGTGNIEVLDNDWYRIQVTTTDAVIGNSYRIYVGGIGGREEGSWFVWHPQVENNSYATDYIPTGAEPAAGDNLALLYGGLVHTPYGFEGNGVDGYIDTQFNPATMGKNYTLNDASMSAVIYKGTGGNIFSGRFGLTGGNLMTNITTLTQRINQDNNNSGNISFTGTGFMSLNRNSSTQIFGINKGTQTIETVNSTSIYDNNIAMFERNGAYSSVGASCISFGGSFMTFAQSQARRANVNNLLKGFGLNEIA